MKCPATTNPSGLRVIVIVPGKYDNNTPTLPMNIVIMKRIFFVFITLLVHVSAVIWPFSQCKNLFDT